MSKNAATPHRFVSGRAILLLLALLSPLLALAQSDDRPLVYRARLKMTIHPVAAELVQDLLREADAARADAVVLEIDTPGGLLTSTREITTAILGSRVPVVVFVSPSGAQAASAGFYILLAADVAAMTPGSNTGAAHPVGAQGEDIEGVVGQKAEQDAAANARALARRHGRNVALAEAAVLQSRSFTAEEALQNRLADVIAPDLPSLLKMIDGRRVRNAPLRTAGAEVRSVEMSSFRRLLAVIADPNITMILLTLGGLGLYFELMNPGSILPGVVGALCLILAFYSLSVLPVNYAGLALLALALLLFIAEIKIVSHGLLTVGGVVALGLGASMLFEKSEPALRVSLSVIGGLVLLALSTVGFLSWMTLRTRNVPVRTGLEGLIHEIGTARSPLNPHGKVFVHGEIWEAVSDEPVAAGEPVEVVAVRNLTLAVRPRRPGTS